jgi:hypothetical protein
VAGVEGAGESAVSSAGANSVKHVGDTGIWRNIALAILGTLVFLVSMVIPYG